LGIEDPREPWKVASPLPEVLLLVVCGTIADCDDYDHIAPPRNTLTQEICASVLLTGNNLDYSPHERAQENYRRAVKSR